jgi:uncharacterized protein (TIGR03066 family)
VLLAVGLLLLLVPACSSNNKDKIVGKWKLVSVPASVPFDMVWEFKSDGNLILTVQALGLSQNITGKYRLKSGDTVEITDLSESMPGEGKKLRRDFLINGDDMTMKGSDGKTVKLKKI